MGLPCQPAPEHRIGQALRRSVRRGMRIPRLSVTERAVHGASMSLARRLWLNIPNALACSRRSGLKSLCENSSHEPVIKKSTLTFGSGRVFTFGESVSNHIFILQNRVFAFFTQALHVASAWHGDVDITEKPQPAKLRQ